MPKFQAKNSRAAKLTPTQVYEIRELYQNGDCTQGQLARDFHMSVVQIGRIVRWEIWNDLPAPPPKKADMVAAAKRLMAVQVEVTTPGLARLREEYEKSPEGLLKGLDEK